MFRLEQGRQEGYPYWCRGHSGRVAVPLLRGVARWSRFDAIDGCLDESVHLRGFEFVDAALRHLQLRYEADDGAARIPAKGRLLIVANHPSGARSEEHTSELQSLMRISYAVFCLKKKIKKIADLYKDELASRTYKHHQQ